MQRLTTLDGGDDDPVVAGEQTDGGGNDWSVEEFAPRHCRVHNQFQFKPHLLQGEIGDFGHLVHATEGDPLDPLGCQRAEELQVVLSDHRVQAGEVAQVLVGQPALLGKTFRGEEIGVAVLGKIVDPDKTFGDQVFQIGIYQAERYV